MAVRWAVQNGNWSDTATWNGGTLPGNGDDVYANGKVVTVDIDLVGQYRPASLWNRANSSYGIVGGGRFEVPQSRQIGESGYPVNVYGSDVSSANYGCVRVTVPAPGVVTVYGDIYGGTNSYCYGLENNSTGTVNVTGNVQGGSSGYAYGIINNSTGTVNVNGNVQGGSSYLACGIYNYGTGTVNVTGNVQGGSNNSACGIYNYGTGTVNVTGNVQGGSNNNAYGIYNNSTGTVIVNGVVGGGASASGVYNASTSTNVIINGSVRPFATTNTNGVYNYSTGSCTINGDVYGGRNAPSVYANNGLITINGDLKWDENLSNAAATNTSTSGRIVLNGSVNNHYGSSGFFGTTLTGGRIVMRNGHNRYTMYTEDDGNGVATGNPVMHYGTALHTGSMPDESDVRYNVAYGPGDIYTGKCHVPPPQSVLYGVPVDNTTGTATVDAASIAAAVWNAQRSSYSASGTFGAVSEWSGGSLNDVILIGSGTVSSDTNNSPIQFKTNLSGSANKFIGLFLKFSSTANAANEIREITAFDQATGVVTLNKALTTTPNSGDTFYLIGYSGR